MAKHILNIDGFIGPWAYSQQWLSEMLKGHEKDEVTINMSSLGGRFDHALNMHDQIAQHGNVTVNLSGFNASSSTIIAMGAKHRRMSENSFFLVHKVMSWIDEFGMMNEDNIEELISRLEKEKNENGKMTLVLAKMYNRITSKDVSEVLSLMKEDTWLNAQETLEWGFVNELYSPGNNQVNHLEDLAKVAMITANGMPSPIRKHQNQPNMETEAVKDFEKQIEASVFKTLVNKLTEYFTPKNNNMKKQFEYINSALETEALESSNDGVFLNEDQLATIDTLIKEGEDHAAKLVDVEKNERKLNDSLEGEKQAREQAETNLSDKEAVITELQTKEKSLDAIIGSMNEIDPSVAKAETHEEKINAIRVLLAAKPGSKPTGVQAASDPQTLKTDGVDWETLNSLPHMQDQQ